MTHSAIADRDLDTKTSLRLYTHNIFGQSADWEQRRQVLADGIKQFAPDLALFQETVVTASYDQISEILAEGYQVVHSTTRESTGQGISIASRWPIVNTRELDLKQASSRTHDFACTTLIAEVAFPAPIGRVLVVNHFPDYHTDHEFERERQAVIAARAIAEIVAQQPAHVLLTGDLDAEPDAGSLRFLTGKQALHGMSVCYRNAWDSVHPNDPGHTFSPTNPLTPRSWPFQRIDHILIRCGSDDMPTLDIASCELAFDKPVGGTWASDHFGVVADFEVR